MTEGPGIPFEIYLPSWTLLITSHALNVYQLMEQQADWVASKGGIKVRGKLAA